MSERKKEMCNVLWFLPSENSQRITEEHDGFLQMTFELFSPCCRFEYILRTSQYQPSLKVFILPLSYQTKYSFP